MHESGVEQILIDDGNIAAQVKDKKFDKILELVGTTTLKDSLQCLAPLGICLHDGHGVCVCAYSSQRLAD